MPLDQVDSLPPTGRRIKRGWMNLLVERVIHETHDTATFYLVDADEGGRPFDYTAGQYLTFRFDELAAKSVVRSYTMSSSPCQRAFSAVTVKRVEGGLVSNWLCDRVRPGTVLRARGPIGKFVYDAAVDCPHLAMVAGGSGVTPFVSIMREYAPILGQQGAPATLTLLVSHRSRADLICHQDLESLVGRPGVKICTSLSREDARASGFWQGRLTEAHLAKAFTKALPETTFMSCGPQAIMDLTAAFVAANGLDSAQLKTESFAS